MQTDESKGYRRPLEMSSMSMLSGRFNLWHCAPRQEGWDPFHTPLKVQVRLLSPSRAYPSEHEKLATLGNMRSLVTWVCPPASGGSSRQRTGTHVSGFPQETLAKLACASLTTTVTPVTALAHSSARDCAVQVSRPLCPTAEG